MSQQYPQGEPTDRDLSSCEQEPIHTPGAIQPHGAVLAASTDGLLVTHASENLAAILGRPAEGVLGRPLNEAIGEAACGALLGKLPRDGNALGEVHSMDGPDANPLDLRAYRSGRHICLDIEPIRPDPRQRPPVLLAQSVLESLMHSATRAELCQIAVVGLKAITGYDRVMAYRFHTDGHGEVIAEDRAPRLEPYLGLHYPASDIPPQARRLYLSQRVGAIADASYRPVPLLVDPAADDGMPLDLTHSALRSASPIHREYMHNMKTAASLTIGLALGTAPDEQKLWGMLVCHHAEPLVAGPELRAVADMIGRVVSLLLGSLRETEVSALLTKRDTTLRALVHRLADPAPLPEVFAAAETELLDLVGAGGALVRISGTQFCLGCTPPPSVAAAALAVLQPLAGGNVLAVDDLGLRYPEFAGCTAEGSGTLLLPLAQQDPGDAILWFRPELAQTVAWGGNPAEHTISDPATGRLSPRRSFAAWKQTVRGRSARWAETDLTFAGKLRNAIKAAMAQRAETELARLRQSAARHRDAAEIASDWIWETEANGTLTFLSKRFGETSGMPWSLASGRLIDDLVALGFGQAAVNELRATADARRAFQDVVHRINLAGDVTRFWRLSGRPFFDPATGAFAGYRGTGTDVTAAMEHEAAMNAALLRAEAAEREAQQARQRLVDAIEAIPEGFILHDADDRLVLCNERYREIYGLTSEQMVPGVGFEEMLRATIGRGANSPNGQETEQGLAERITRHRAIDGNHYEQHLANGRWLQVEERRTSDGGTVGIRVDVTEARWREALEQERKRAIAELRAARLLQTGLLPSARLQKEVIAKSGLDIASRSASCTELGGDLWGLSDLGHRRVGVYTLDVAGHGTAAALNTFRVHTLIHELGGWLLEPAVFLKELNSRLVDLLTPGTFATMFYGIIDPDSNCITYAAAGSPPPLIRCGTGVPPMSLDSAGVPLGISAGVDYPCLRADFGPGGMLFLFSDILTDFADERGNRAGEEGAFALIQSCAGEATAEAAVARVCAPFLDPPGTPLSDDLTVVCIMRS